LTPRSSAWRKRSGRQVYASSNLRPLCAGACHFLFVQTDFGACQLLNSLAEEEKYTQKSFVRRPSLPALRSLSSEQSLGGNGGARTSARDRARSSTEENTTTRASAETRSHPVHGGFSARESARDGKKRHSTETTRPERSMPANRIKPPREKVQRCHLDAT
jgi:hypothetical protein